MTVPLEHDGISFSQIFNSIAAENANAVVGEGGAEVGQEVYFSVMRRSTSNVGHELSLAAADPPTSNGVADFTDNIASGDLYADNTQRQQHYNTHASLQPIEIQDHGYQYSIASGLPLINNAFLNGLPNGLPTHMYNLPLQDHAPAAEPSTSDPQLNIQPELTLPPPRQTPPVLDSSHTPMPGIYNFRVRLGHFDSTNPTGKLTGSTTYSSLLDRLFINMGVYTPITLFSHTPPPEGAVVRCFVVFSSQEKCTTTVTRCPNHRSATDHSNTGNDPQKAPLTHILQVSHPQAQYLTTPSGVESAVVPYNARESSVKNSAAKKERTAGFGAFQDTTSIRYMCYSSCAGSINRENIHTVFRLELGSDILGVASLDTKICSCPSRDRTKAEKLTRQQEASGTTGSSRKRSEKGRDSPSHSTDIASTGATKDSHTSERIQAPSIVHPHSSQATLVGKRSQRLIQNVQHKLPTRINTADTHTAHPMRWSTAQSTRIATADSTVGIDEDAVYYVAVRGRQNYEVLSRVADGLNALAQRPPRARSFRQHNPLPTRTPSLLVTSNPPPPPTTTANTAAPTNTNTNTNTNTSTDTKTVFSRPGQNSTIPSLSSRRNPSLVSSTTSVPPAQPRTAASSRSLRTVPSRERRVSGTVPSDVPVSESPARNTRARVIRGIDITINGHNIRQNRSKRLRTSSKNSAGESRINVKESGDGTDTEEEPELVCPNVRGKAPANPNHAPVNGSANEAIQPRRTRSQRTKRDLPLPEFFR